MERRTFVKGALSLAMLAACGAGASVMRVPVAAGAKDGAGNAPLVGPALREGVRLCASGDADGDAVAGYVGDVHVFDANPAAAALIRLADGTRTIEEITDEVPEVSAGDAALLFVELGQAGFLANTVLVNLYETAS